MNEEMTQPPSQAEARAALAEVDRIIDQTRRALAQGPSAALLILWGCIWLAADVTTQFYPAAMQWLWWVLDGVGILGSWWIGACHGAKIKSPGAWRYGVFWLVLFAYAALWVCLLLPVNWPQTDLQWEHFEPVYRRITAYIHTIPMFAYVVGGLWLGRFFVWLGLLVTALIVVGLWFVPHYYYLWLGIAGGGSLIVAGVFIRKFWK